MRIGQSTARNRNRISTEEELKFKLEAKDVVPNINRTQAAEWAEKCRFCPW